MLTDIEFNTPVSVSRQGIVPVMNGNGNVHMYKSYPSGFSGKSRRKTVTSRSGPYGSTRNRPRYGSRALGSDKERKFHGLSDESNTFTTAGARVNLNLIPQGVTEITRIGRKIFVKVINLRLSFILSPQTSVQVPATSRVRFLLIQDKQCNGALPATTDILETADEMSYLNLANQSRFRVLKDWLETMDSPGGAGDGSVANDWSGKQHVFKYHKKCNIPIEFNSTTGAVTEITSNNIIVLALANNTNAIWSIWCRLRFTD